MVVTAPGSLRERLRRGAIWSIAGHLANVAVRLGTNLLLAHFLAPATFGVANLGQTVVSGLSMFSDIGLRPFLVVSPRASEPGVANTLWTLQIGRGLMIGVVTGLIGLALAVAQSAGWVGPERGFGNTQLPGVMLALALIPMIGGFESTRTAEAQRNLQVRSMTLLTTSSQFVGATALVVAAWVTRSVWAIPIGGLASIVTTTILGHTMLRGTRNRLAWQRDVVPEILSFGRWIFLSSTIGFFANSLDRLILGATVSAAQLGVYSIAATAVSLMVDGLSRLMNDLALPAFSEVSRDRPQELRRVHYRFRRPFEIVCFVCMGGLIASGNSLVHFLYDHRYAAAGPMIGILAWSLLALRYRITSTVLLATGDSQNQFHNSLASVCSVALCSGVGLELADMHGFLIGLAVAPMVACSVTIWRAHERGLIDWLEELRWLPLIPVGYGVGLSAAYILDLLPSLH